MRKFKLSFLNNNPITDLHDGQVISLYNIPFTVKDKTTIKGEVFYYISSKRRNLGMVSAKELIEIKEAGA